MRPPAPSRPLVPDLLSHRLVRSSPERNSPTSKPPLNEQGWRYHSITRSSAELLMPCTFIQSRSFHQRERLIFYVYVLYCICYVCLSIIYCIYPCTFAFYPLGGSGVVWSKLQEVLSSVEDSISFRRTWAAPITASDQEKHREHLRAAQENWVKASQV